jgi:hypothetical protein
MMLSWYERNRGLYDDLSAMQGGYLIAPALQ